MTTPVLELDDIVMHFPARAGAFGNRGDAVVHAVDGVSLAVQPNETVALVGESGCGKSTTARVALGLLEPTAGTVRIDGQDLAQVSRRDLKQLRQRAQIVFQDPFASLDPRMRVSSIVAEPLRAQGQGSEARTRVPELLGLVGLSAEHAGRYPHEFSGGQRQRIGIARALALAPDLLVLDEPVSALDVSIRAQVLNLLTGLQDQLSLAYLFISHDLAVVRHIANRVAVMYLGKIVEFGPARDVYADAGHPYTRALLSAVPEPDPARERVRQRIVLRGDLPSAIDPPSGCRFRTRCWKAQDLCAQEEPALVDRGHGHPVACHFPE